MEVTVGQSAEPYFASEPMLRKYYEMYQFCRTNSLVVYEKPEGTEGATKLVTVVWPTGFSFLPHPGGVEQQDYLTMRLLAAFLRGEQVGCIRLMDR